MKTITEKLSNGDTLAANVFKTNDNVSLACLDDTGSPNWVADLPRDEMVRVLRSLADQIEKAVP